MARHPSVVAEPADAIPAAPAGTLPGLFRARVARSPDAVAYTEFDSGSGQWRAQRWRDIQARVARWRTGLEREGMQPGDRVAILKVPATDLEAAIGLDPLVEQVVVLGEARSFLVALLVLRRAAWMDLARRLGLPAEEPASLRAGAAVAAVLGRVAAALRPFPDHAQVRAVSLSLQPWTIAEGLLTPTLKPRRPRLEARFAAEIAALYQGHPGLGGGGAGGRPPGLEQNAQRPGHPGA